VVTGFEALVSGSGTSRPVAVHASTGRRPDSAARHVAVAVPLDDVDDARRGISLGSAASASAKRNAQPREIRIVQ
jgi:hypothetical protein